MADLGLGTTESLRRIEQLLATIVKVQLAPVLERELADARLKHLYELTGSVTAKEATNRLKCSMSTVVDAWQRWERLGLLAKDGRQYRKVL